MSWIGLHKIEDVPNARIGTLNVFVTPDNEAFLKDENGVIYAFGGGAASFLALLDVPDTYIGNELKILRAKADGSGLEFIENTGGGGTWGTIVGTISDQSDLWDILVSTVRITGNQTIEGVKTFSSSPIVPYPTTEFQAVNKGYLDDLIGEGTLIRSGQVFGYDVIDLNVATLDFIPDNMLYVALNGQVTDRWSRTGDQLTVTDWAEGDFIIVGYYKSLALVNSLPEARIESFSLNVISDILGEVTAVWYDQDNTEHSVTGLEKVFAGTPESGDFRWDLIKLNFDGSVSVITGVESTNPERPSEGTGGLIGGELIWNDLGEFIIVEPSVTFPNDRYQTKLKANNEGNFAKVLSGPLAKGQMYSLQLSYTNYSSDWSSQGKGDTGILNVTFLSNNSNNINSTSVKIETVAGNSEAGDWVLVDATGGLWELWHKSKAFWGRTQYRIVFFNDVVNKDWFIQNAPYVSAIPANDAEYPSEVFGGGGSGDMLVSVYDPVGGAKQVAFADEMFPDYEPSTGNILFSPLNGKPRKYGFTTALTGNITFETTGASETIMAKARWNDSTLPTVSVSGGGVTLIKIGDFEVSVDNYIEAICHKNDSGTVTAISYSITQA